MQQFRKVVKIKFRKIQQKNALFWYVILNAILKKLTFENIKNINYANGKIILLFKGEFKRKLEIEENAEHFWAVYHCRIDKI